MTNDGDYFALLNSIEELETKLTEATARADAAEQVRDTLAYFLKRITYLHDQTQPINNLIKTAKKYLIDQKLITPLRDEEQTHDRGEKT